MGYPLGLNQVSNKSTSRDSAIHVPFTPADRSKIMYHHLTAHLPVPNRVHQHEA